MTGGLGVGLGLCELGLNISGFGWVELKKIDPWPTLPIRNE